MRTPKAPAPRQPIPKLEDVATRAGVSAATVSRYYNNPSIVAPATAARIQEAISRAIEEGVRTADIASAGEATWSTEEVGREIVRRVKVEVGGAAARLS